MMSLISGGSSIGGGEFVLAGTERIYYGWDHYIADASAIKDPFPARKPSLYHAGVSALWSQPIRAQYLDESRLWWLERFCLTPASQSDCQWWRDNNSLWSSLSSAWSRPWPSPQTTVHTRTCRKVNFSLSLVKIRPDTVLWLVEIIVLLRQLCQVMATKATFYYHYGCCVFMT